MAVPVTGYTELDLVGFTDKGTYNAATTYVANDLVSYNGIKWKCLQDGTVGVTPAEGVSWSVFIIDNEINDNAVSATSTWSSQKINTTKADQTAIAPVENGTTASRAYAIGENFMKDGAFCTAIAAIAQGATFTLDTNYTAGTVGARVAEIEDYVDAQKNILVENVEDIIIPIRKDVFKYIKQGQSVQITINNTAYGANFISDTQIAKVPFRPKEFTRFFIVDLTKTLIIGYVDLAGNIVISGYTANSLLYGSFCYITID